MDDIQLLSEWLLENDHQCNTTKSPCWCVVEREHRCSLSTSPEASEHDDGARQSEASQRSSASQQDGTGQQQLAEDSCDRRRHKREHHQNPGSRLKQSYRRKAEKSEQENTLNLRFSECPLQMHRPFRFLSLPDEVRSRIYMCLFPRKAFHWYWHNRTLADQNPSWNAFLRNFAYPTAVLRTCKSIHREATATMYNDLVMVCDLRPDRFSGFNLTRFPLPAPSLSLITDVVLNIKLDAQYITEGHRWVDPRYVHYRQLGQLTSLKRLGVRVGFEEFAWLLRGETWYNGLLKAHLQFIIAVLPSTTAIEGIDIWPRIWKTTEMCASMELELSDCCARKEWVDQMVAETRRKLVMKSAAAYG